MAEKKLKKGDKVEWNSQNGTTSGEVVKKETKTTKAGGHTAKATASEPQYRVKSEKTGKEAVHKPSELKKK